MSLQIQLHSINPRQVRPPSLPHRILASPLSKGEIESKKKPKILRENRKGGRAGGRGADTRHPHHSLLFLFLFLLPCFASRVPFIAASSGSVDSVVCPFFPVRGSPPFFSRGRTRTLVPPPCPPLFPVKFAAFCPRAASPSHAEWWVSEAFARSGGYGVAGRDVG